MSEIGQWIRPNEKSTWTRAHDRELWEYEIFNGNVNCPQIPRYDKNIAAALRVAQVKECNTPDGAGLAIYVGASGFTAHYMGESEDFDVEAETCSEAVAWAVWFWLQDASYRAAQYEEKVARI